MSVERGGRGAGRRPRLTRRGREEHCVAAAATAGRAEHSTRPCMKENANKCRQGMTNRVGDKINGSENRPGILSRGDTDVD